MEMALGAAEAVRLGGTQCSHPASTDALGLCRLGYTQ
jgi:hypothetical protein